MEERKLNFNVPLLSVRRFFKTPVSTDGEKGKMVENSLPNRRRTLPFYQADASLDQVTEPVTVPFQWEQIPGKAKDGIEPDQSQYSNYASVTPRLPPGRVLDVIKYPLEKEFDHQNSVRPQIETFPPVNESTIKVDSTKEGMDEKWGSESENDEDVYSDALDVLSPTDSLSLNCSISGLSGSGSPDVRPTETFSTDVQTRDFMMSRFLPAAKAMTLEQPQYASRKQPVVLEQPREVKKVIAVEMKPPPVSQYDSIIIPHYEPGVDEEESTTEDGDDEYDNSGNLSKKACGLFPRLCFKNSLYLLNPVPGLKVRTQSSLSSSSKVGKPGKAPLKVESHNQIVEKQFMDAVYKQKSNGEVQSPRLTVIGNKVTSGSNRFTNKIEQQIANRSSPYRSSGGSRISPYRRERPQSPFHGGGFLGIPKDANFKSNFSNKLYRSSNNSQELLSTKQGSGSASPTVEKTLYVDTVNFADTSNSNSSSFDNQIDSRSKHSKTLRGSRAYEDNSTMVSPFQDIKCLNVSEGRVISEPKFSGFVDDHRSSFSETAPRLSVRAETMKCLTQDEGLEQEFKSLECIKVSATGNLNHSTDIILKEDDGAEAKGGSDHSSLPPPLPKMPSESWLCRALPSVTSQSAFSRSYTGTRFHPKKLEPVKAADSNTKWETIVKTSHLHHDHVRYSEELITHVSLKPRT